jgi:hypothetical protein
MGNRDSLQGTQPRVERLSQPRAVFHHQKLNHRAFTSGDTHRVQDTTTDGRPSSTQVREVVHPMGRLIHAPSIA